MAAHGYKGFLQSANSDSSDDAISNEDVNEERSPYGYSPFRHPPMVDSADEEYTPDETGSCSSQTSSGVSSGGSSFSPHVQSNMYPYEQSHASNNHPSKKRKSDHIDSDHSDYGSSINDDACPIRSFSNSSSSKRKKYDFDSCAKEVETDFNVAPIAQKIMKKFGYEVGKGLGRNKQGITAPINASKQRGRSGIGHSVKDLEPANLVWDDTFEEVSVEEYPDWLDGDHLPTLTHMELENWPKEGPKIMQMDSFSDFCDSELLHDILESKTVFDNLTDKDLLDAVKRSNPFETVAKGIFLNRAAMKMANIDRVFDYMFTEPLDRCGRQVVTDMDLLYFADVCAGPGGFSEYVLWKKSWQAKGIGFTLRNECDFKLESFKAGTPETFEPYYGEKQDGDVYDPINIESLTRFVMSKTDNLGVHFMMADGGFSVSGQENIQEIMSKRLYLCQLLVALSIVRVDGHFVCKLFDIFSPFSVGLIYLMYRSFAKISIHKPNTSRPANSERYIICKFKRSDCEDIRAYMFNLNLLLNDLEPNSNVDIVECVPLAEMTGDLHFFNHIYNSNNKLGRRQLVHLKKVIAFCRDNKLTELKQQDFRRKCLEYWGVPSETRRIDNTPPEIVVEQILGKNNCDFIKERGEELSSEEQLKSLFLSIYDWTCIPVSNHDECHFYIGCRGKVYVLKKNGKAWVNVDPKVKLELSPGTLVFGEIVEEVTGASKAQRRDKFFHIIDAFQLGKKNIMNRSYLSRLQLCKLYTKALHKDWYVNYTDSSSSLMSQPINLRVNDYFEFKNLMSIFQGIEIRPSKYRNEEILLALKNEHPRSICSPDDMHSPEYYFPAKGILFYKTTRNPWHVHFSKGHKKFYYYRVGQPTVFEVPSDITATAMDCYSTRRFWTWEMGAGIKGEPPQDGILHMSQLLNFVKISKEH